MTSLLRRCFMRSRTAILLLTACFVALVFLAAAPAPPAPEGGPGPVFEVLAEGPDDESGHRVRVLAPRAGADVFYFGSSGSWLGVSIADIDEKRAGDLGLREIAGAEVKAVVPEGPAAKAGIKEGDVILSYQGTTVQGVAQLTRLVRETPAGRKVRLDVSRGGSRMNLEVEVGERGSEHDFHKIVRRIEIPDVEIPDIEIPDIDIDIAPHVAHLRPRHGAVLLGVAVEPLNDQLREYFGVKGGGGVLVRHVREKGPAAEAGMRAGDVIVKIDDQEIDGGGDLRRALRERRGQTIRITVIRDRRERSLNATLPEKGDGRSYRTLRWEEAPDSEEGIHEHRERMREMREQLRDEARRIRSIERDRLRQERERMRREPERRRLVDSGSGQNVSI